MPRGDPYGSFSGAFTGTVSFDWAPEPLIVADELRSMAGQLENMEAPLQAARQIAANDIQERFETKTDPEGGKWAPWAASYKDRAPGTLLEATGAMRAAAASPSAFDVMVYEGGGEVVFSGAGLPEYWIYHQMGAVRSGHTAETRRFIREFTGAEPTGNVLPARPFVGLSEKAEIAIIDAFDEWFAGIVGFFVHAGGGVQTRLPSGRFGPRVA